MGDDAQERELVERARDGLHPQAAKLSWDFIEELTDALDRTLDRRETAERELRVAADRLSRRTRGLRQAEAKVARLTARLEEARNALQACSCPVVLETYLVRTMSGGGGEYGRRPVHDASSCLRCAALAASSGEPEAQKPRCGSLFPGGHGETRDCVLPPGHEGPHRYSGEPDTQEPFPCNGCGSPETCGAYGCAKEKMAALPTDGQSTKEDLE